MNITSEEIKLALMHYYRFQYGYICVDECDTVRGKPADILVDTGSEIIEVEVKISKNDLIEGEKVKKIKHLLYETSKNSVNNPNKFLFCVPSYLVDDAIPWVKELNPKYGVIEYDEKGFRRVLEYSRKSVNYTMHNCFLCVRKSAKKLHEQYDNKLRWKISKRLASKTINLWLEKFLTKGDNNE